MQRLNLPHLWYEKIRYDATQLLNQALKDFILITQYRSHDDGILRYLNHALYRINSFKEVFRQTLSIEQKIEESHFNFPKFHVLSHYASFIRKYEAANEYDTSHDEIKHKYLIKKFYDESNKRETFQTQYIALSGQKKTS